MQLVVVAHLVEQLSYDPSLKCLNTDTTGYKLTLQKEKDHSGVSTVGQTIDS